MKCDKLKAYNVVATADVNPEVVDSLGCTEWAGYDKGEVDAAITELKDRIHELESIPHTDNSAVIERLSNENERLKAKLESVQASMYADVVDAGMENRKLQRALWLARAKRALEKIAWFKLWNASISTMNPEDGARQEYDKWKKALGKCLAKVKEYK